jgi:putative transposase
MKRSKRTEVQIAFALKEAEVGTAVAKVCLEPAISEATFYIYGRPWIAS